MATCSPNLTVTATSSASPQTLYDNSTGASPDAAWPCFTYTVHNRDATNAVRVLVTPLHNPADSPNGAPIGPGATIPFRWSAGGGIKKVVIWTEGGTPSIDGFVEGV